MMRMIKTRMIALVLALTVLATPALSRAQDGPWVDALLVMAIDASASVSQTVLEGQLEGHAGAFRDPLVHNALQSGFYGRIGVAVMLWSNPTDTNLVIPWRVLESAEDAMTLAADIDAIPRDERAGSTGLGAALAAGERHIRRAPFRSDRRIIDISSNGFNNIGPRPEFLKPALEVADIEVNAIVILDEYDWLKRYFAESVVVGTGAFVMPAGGVEDYADAILRKLVRELSYNLWRGPVPHRS